MAFWLQGMQAGIKSACDRFGRFSETDLTEKKIDVPTPIVHGDDDQIVPIAASAMLSSKTLPNATLKVYRGGSRSLAQIQVEGFNNDLLACIRS